MTPALRERVAAAAVGAAGLALLLPLRGQGIMINDEGWIVYPALRMQAGDVLYRDVWTFYAPLRYHVFAGLFDLAGPSLLLVRTVWVAAIAAAAAGLYGVARRLAPPSLAWLPSAVYLLAPGPWHKAPYALCTVAFFLALARALERPGAGRFLLLGAVAGFTLVTRQDLGVAQLGLSLLAAAAVARFGSGTDPEAAGAGGAGGDGFLRRSARAGSAVALGFAAPVAPFAVTYAWHGALGALVDLVFVRAVAQMGAHGSGLAQLLDPGDLAGAPEGRAAGVLLLLPIPVYAATAVLLARRLLRARPWAGRRLDPRHALVAAVLAYGAATLPQAWRPLLLLRLLQSAVPFYLLAAWLAAEARAALCVRRPGLARAVAPAAAALAAALPLLVIAGPRFAPYDEYSGSWRMRHYTHPVSVPGGEVRVDLARADEIRLVRAFLAERTRAGEPIFAAPLFSLYYVLADRPNPTRLLAEHLREGEHVHTTAQKQAEMERLLASPARYAVVDRGWLAQPQPPGPIRRALVGAFHPVRMYGRALVLERGRDPLALRLIPIYRRVALGRAREADRATLEEIARARPRAPLPRALLGELLAAQGELETAAAALLAAAALDRADASLLERAAALRARQGRLRAAARLLRRALAVRESPAARRALERLAGRAAAPDRSGRRGAGPRGAAEPAGP